MDLREIEYECVKWIHLTQDRVQWQTFLSDRLSAFHKRPSTMELVSHKKMMQCQMYKFGDKLLMLSAFHTPTRAVNAVSE